MKKKSASRSAFFNPRVLTSLAFCAIGVLLLLGVAFSANPAPPGVSIKDEQAARAAQAPHPVASSVLAPASAIAPADQGRPPEPNVLFAILYDQNDNPGANSTSSQNFEAANDAFDNNLADDFVVPAGQTWTIQQVVVSAVYFNGTGPAASFNVAFYPDAATLPGAVVSSQLNATYVNAGGVFTITLPASVVLGPGTYWVSVQANMDFAVGGQWGWTDRTVQANSGAAWQNPGGGFAVGCLTWGRRGATCTIDPAAPDQMFQILGTTGGGGPSPTPGTPTPTATATPCSNYSFTVSTGAIVPGTTDTGNHTDDASTVIALPFAYTLYDQTFNNVAVGSNGHLTFGTVNNGFNPTCIPIVTATYAIFPYETDQCTLNVAGCVNNTGTTYGIFTSTSGAAPNRIFNVEYRTAYYNSADTTLNYEVRLYEGQTAFDVVYGTINTFTPPAARSLSVGLQRTNSTQFVVVGCDPTAGGSNPPVSSGQLYHYTLGSCASPTPGTPSPTPTSTATTTPTSTATGTPPPTPTGTPCGGTALSENFDGVTAPALPAGWVATNTGVGPLWVTSTTTPDTPPNDAFADDQDTVTDKLLDTPGIAITSTAAQVSFRNFYNTESTFDGGVLEVSSPNINAGAFTDVTAAAVGGSFAAGGYNATISTDFGSPISGRMAWSGNAGSYINTVANLGPNVAGQTIKLRFRMASDDSVSATGWRVDTVTVVNGACPSATPTATNTPTASPSATATCGGTGGGTPGPWTTGATGPPLRYRAGGASDGNFIYVFGGGDDVGGFKNDLWRWDPATETWTQLANMPSGKQNIQGAYANGKIYVPGGFATGSVHITELAIYDIATNTWSTGASLPAAQTGTTVAFNNKIYNFGGNPGPQTTTTIYDIATNTWTTGAPMPVATTYGRAVASGGFAYYVGGIAGSTTAAVHRYDFAANTWTTVAPLQTARTSAEMMASADGSSLFAVMGGDSTFFTGVPQAQSVEIYNIAGNSWTFGNPVLTKAAAPSGGSAGGKLMVQGGTDNAIFLNNVQVSVLGSGSCPSATPTATATATGGGPTCTPIITQSSTQTITAANSVSCNNGVGHTDNSYWRAFNMISFAGGAQYTVTDVDFGVESANITQPVTVRLYTNAGGAFPGGTRTQIATTTINVTAAQTGTVVTTPLAAVVPAGTSELVMELFTPNGEAGGALFFVGSNADPQTGLSYLSAADCGVTTPTDTGALGFPNMHIVFNVHGGCNGGGQSATPTATATATCAAGWAAGPNFPDVGAVRAPGNYFPSNGRFYSIGGRNADVAGADFTHPFEYNPATNAWVTKPSTLPDGQVNNMACGVLNVGGTDQIYCLGGSMSQVVGTASRVFSYNPATDTFTTLTAADNWPGSQGGTFLPGGFAVAGNKLYTIGSFNASAVPPVVTAQVWQFDPNAAVGSRWLARTDYPVARGYVPAATIGGFIYTAGGSNLDAGGLLIDTNDSFKYDPVSGAWTAIANIPRATAETRAVVMNNQMWVLGGGRVAPNPSNEVDIYDPGSNTWTTGVAFSAARRNFPADSDGTSRVFLAGGYDTSGTTLLNTMEIFGSGGGCPSATPTATATFTPTPTATATATSTGTPVVPTPTPTPTSSVTPTPGTTPAAQPLNLSTRLRVQAGENVGIGGFIITGNDPKRVIVRGLGPSLPVPDALADTVLELHGPGGAVLSTNDNWRDTQEAEILATGLQPPDDLESAIVATLNPGAYTAVLGGRNATSGVALIEIYDLNSATTDSKLANISTRAFVDVGSNVVIAGFILGGNSADDNVVVRGIGPSLPVSTALADPVLELHNGQGGLIITNHNWQDDAGQAAYISSVGLAPPNPLESGIAATLPPGLYTAILAGEGGGMGVGLVEVYSIGAGAPIPTPTPGGPSATPVATATATATATAGGPSPTPGTCVENFDSVTAPALPPGWVASNPDPGDGSMWATTTTTPDTAPNAVNVADQDGISDKVVTRTGVSIANASAVMSFRNNFNTEFTGGTYWDGFVLEVSSPNISGGDFLDITDSHVGGTIVSGGYTGEIDGTANNPLAGRMAWSGDSGGYIDTVINMGPNLAGQTVTLRFRMGSDEAVAAPGAWVDTISITNASCP